MNSASASPVIELKDCPNRPNCVCTQASKQTHRMPPLRCVVSPEEALQIIEGILQATPRVKILQRTDRYLHATFTTALLRFVDDVEFAIDDAQNLLHFRSASRLGYSDLGLNRKRMTGLVEQLLATGAFASL